MSGLIGARLLTYVTGTQRGYRYNGKAGKDNTAGIVIYSIIVSVFGIVVVMFAALAILRVPTR